MGLILSLDTSAKVCSVALHENGELLASQEVNLDRVHSRLLTTLINRVLADTLKEKTDLVAVAVSQGPGSYTGLRIGVSVAKGLCYALGIPLIGVSALASMAWQVRQMSVEEVRVCPMLDARRMEVFYGIYSSKGGLLQAEGPLIFEEGVFQEELGQGKLVFCGDGAPKLKALVGDDPNAVFVDGLYPSAIAMGALAFEKYQANDLEDVAYFVPVYLKEFQTSTPKKRLF